MTPERIQLFNIHNADDQRGLPEHQQWWYRTALLQLLKDPSFAAQLDIGPMPGTEGQFELLLRSGKIANLYAVRLTEINQADPIGHWRGLVGNLFPGSVLHRVPLFASVQIRKDGSEHDLAVLSDAYRLMADYLADSKGFGSTSVLCMQGYHAQALEEAGFTKVATIPQAARAPKRSYDDIHVYVKDM